MPGILVLRSLHAMPRLLMSRVFVNDSRCRTDIRSAASHGNIRLLSLCRPAWKRRCEVSYELIELKAIRHEAIAILHCTSLHPSFQPGQSDKSRLR